MTFLDYLSFFVACMIIISKFFDCQSTATRISNIHQESNPIARRLFILMGTKTAIWLIFGLTILISLLCLYLVMYVYDSIIYQCLYIVAGLTVSIIQFAVAISNRRGKLNAITTLISRLFNKL